MLQSESPSTVPNTFGAYRITRLIGRGGMGEVYEGIHERTGAPVAIKVLLPDFGGRPTLLARFKREAEITSRLRHPNIVKVFDFDQLPDGRPFIAMELLSGASLDAVIQRGTPMPLPRVASILEQVALALESAHAVSVVHRDLKPANLFLETLPGADRELVRILDFGISKIRDGSSSLTQTMAVIGTPHYMSPEQALGRTREIDGRSDQFSLAAIVFELLTGRAAFGPDDPTEDDPAAAVLFRVVHATPPALASLHVDVPSASEAALWRALSKDPKERFESITVFAKSFLRPLRPMLDAQRDRATEVLKINEHPILSLAVPTPVPPAKARIGETRLLPSLSAESLEPVLNISGDPTTQHFRAWIRRGALLAAAGLVGLASATLGRGIKLQKETPSPTSMAAAPASPILAANADAGSTALTPPANTTTSLPAPVNTTRKPDPAAAAPAPAANEDLRPPAPRARRRTKPSKPERNEDIL
ncbi:MAG: protein kinase [Deltaproteobacteria bacterium]|nr:protein kinase [Deltaproteobacteria bacterium]